MPADILQWAEPLVRDRLAAAWGRVACEADVRAALCDLQWRAWRSALSNLPYSAAACRRELGERAKAAALPPETIEEGDEAVIDELADVIVSRFRRSPALAKNYTKALVLTAAGMLAPRGARAA